MQSLASFALLITVSLGFTDVVRWHSVLDAPLRIERLFDLSKGEYKAGHRGVDMQAQQGDTVYSPVDGEVTFVGTVVDRGVLTVRASNGALISVEPVSAASAEVAVGGTVKAGDALARVHGASHCGTTCLHIGLRVNDRYHNPIRLLLSDVKPRLLPLD